jgi:RNA polymerase sigma-70 factor (ECF subfamily)
MSLSKPGLVTPAPFPISVGDRLDEAAIESEVLCLFDECERPLRRYAMSFGLAREAAEDIVQDAFISLFRHLRLGRSRANLRGWLFRVTHNLALKHRRNARRRGVCAELAHASIADHIDPAANPEERMANLERRQRWRVVFRALPERDQRCLILRAEGLRYRDIAAVLGVSLGAVASSMTRAITRLTNADPG